MDETTAEYFDRETPSYGLARMEYVFDFLLENAAHNQDLLDVGCGVGDVLYQLIGRTPIRSVAGLDISRVCLQRTEKLLGCPTFWASIVDAYRIGQIGRRFDFVLMGAVLHHLVGSTRRACARRVKDAIRNAFTLVRPGGYLIICEPGIYPARTAALLFYTKRFVTLFTSRRLQILGKHNNIGAPLISYLTDGQLKTILRRAVDGTVVETMVEDEVVSRLWSLCGIKRRINTTLIVHKI